MDENDDQKEVTDEEAEVEAEVEETYREMRERTAQEKTSGK